MQTKTSSTFSATRAGRPDKSGLKREPVSQMAFGRLNFILMAVAGAAIVIGFLLMLGGSSTADNFNPDIFSTRRIVVGPTLAFLGFAFMAIAIIVNPDRKKAEKSEPSTRSNPEQTA